MKNIYIYIVITAVFIGIPFSVFANPTSVDRIPGFIQPLVRTDYIKADHFVATSTTATSTLPRVETTGLNNTGFFTFNGVTGSTWAAFCTTITGSADLCDGSDASGSGGGTGTVSTSTHETSGYIPYWTSTSATPATLGSDSGLQFNSTIDRLTVPYASTTALTVSGHEYTSTTTVSQNLISGLWNGTTIRTIPLLSVGTTSPYDIYGGTFPGSQSALVAGIDCGDESLFGTGHCLMLKGDYINGVSGDRYFTSFLAGNPGMYSNGFISLLGGGLRSGCAGLGCWTNVNSTNLSINSDTPDSVAIYNTAGGMGSLSDFQSYHPAGTSVGGMLLDLYGFVQYGADTAKNGSGYAPRVFSVNSSGTVFLSNPYGPNYAVPQLLINDASTTNAFSTHGIYSRNGALNLGSYSTSTGVFNSSLSIKAQSASSDFVGIGTTTPGVQLDVFRGAVGPQLRVIGNAVGGNDSSMDFAARNGVTATYGRVGINAVDGTPGAEIGGLFFSTVNTGTLSQKMTIMADGKVGIGTTSPYAKLSVVGQTVSAYFTATTTTASTFPQASTTQVTVSGKLYAPSSSSILLSATSSMGTGTTTTKISGFSQDWNFTEIGCTSYGTGTFKAQIGDSTSTSTLVTSSTNNTTTFTTLSANNSFTRGEAFYIAFGSVSGTVSQPSCSYTRVTK